VLFHEGPAAAAGLHNRYRPLFDLRPPSADIATRLLQALLLRTQVNGRGTTAARPSDGRHANAEAIQRSRRSRVKGRRAGWLNTAFQHQDTFSMSLRRSRQIRILLGRDFSL